MSLNYASLLHVLSPPFLLLNSSRLDRRLDDDLITSARRVDVRLLAQHTHACTCYYKFPGNQGRGQPVWSWAAATLPPPTSSIYLSPLVSFILFSKNLSSPHFSRNLL